MYNFIIDLGDDRASLRSPELDALAHIWHERRKELDASGACHDFNKKLQREWAIETGIIERLYTWDRGVTEVLIEQGIEAALIAHGGGMTRQKAETVAAMIKDHETVVDGLFEFVKSERVLSEHYIRQIHAEFTAHQDFIEVLTGDGRVVAVPLLKGQYKQSVNNPMRQDGTQHLYCPPEHVQSEMQNLIGWFNERERHQEKPEVLSAFLHHRFTQIHPFQDGNGRVARALASIVFLKSGLFPLVIRDSERTEYIGALEQADGGDLQPLCVLFARNQKKSVLAAMDIEPSVQQARHAKAILDSGLNMLKNRSQTAANRADEVFVMADHLRIKASERFTSLVLEYREAFCRIDASATRLYDIECDTDGHSSQRGDRFRRQIVEISEKYGYFANLNSHCGWASLTIHSLNEFQFVVAFHGLGAVHRGIMAASSFTFFRTSRAQEQDVMVIDLHPSAPDFFQFNHMEAASSVESRFAAWLERSLVTGLSAWQQAVSRDVGVV